MSLFNLKNKSILITGSSRGIGKSIAHHCAIHGANVIISSRKFNVCENTAAEINKSIGKEVAFPIAANISDEEQLNNLVSLTKDKWGRIATLICNAATNPFMGSMLDMPSDKFDKSFVILGSGMDKDILNEAEISSADILISLTNSDETNFISAAFAKSDGCQRVIALLNNKDFQGLIRSVDIGDFIDPKAITVSSILRHVRRGRIRNIYTLSDGSAEVIEGEVSSSSELVGPTIEDLHLADGLRIGGILRTYEIIMPRGDTNIKEGDYVTIFSIPSKIHEVEQLFRVSASYY